MLYTLFELKNNASGGRTKMFRIGEFSRLAMVSIRMLRHYDEIGLLTPNTVDPYTGYRYYSAGQLGTVSRIQLLREMGVSLGEIKSCSMICSS